MSIEDVKKDPRLKGWIKDPRDPRDFIYKAVTPRRAIPDVVDLSKFLPNIRNQGNEGACVGFGIAINLTATAIQQGADPEWFGPRWIYNLAREIEHRLDQEGAYPRDACDGILKYGSLKEHFWEYKPKVESYMKATTHPNAPHALEWKIEKYDRADNWPDGIINALADQRFVSLGIPWYYEWMNPDKDGVLPTPVNLVGGHEFCVCGYDLKNQRFKFANSWDTVWGPIGGFGYLPFGHFNRIMADGGGDAHVFTIKWGVAPPPNPTEDFPVDQIASVRILDRLKDVYEFWTEWCKPNTVPDGNVPVYRWAGNISNQDVFIEAIGEVTLKDGRIREGKVRLFHMKKGENPPPPPPPPQEEPLVIIELPEEGSERIAGEEFEVKARVIKNKEVQRLVQSSRILKPGEKVA